MKIRRPSRLLRIWPLVFSALALVGILHLTPTLHEDFNFARDGVASHGWYTDLEAQNRFIHYAYQVGGWGMLAALRPLGWPSLLSKATQEWESIIDEPPATSRSTNTSDT